VSTPSDSFLYLSSEQVAGLDISPEAVTEAVENVFLGWHEGDVLQQPKINIPPRPKYISEALLAVDNRTEHAAVKWVSVSPDNAALGLPNVQSMVLYSETRHGRPLALMDGTWLTGVRTAACSVIGAKYLAVPRPYSLGLIGAGYQARMHLDFLRAQFPSLDQVTAYSGGSDSAHRFREYAESQGIAASVASAARDAVAHQDIVVSMIPPGKSDRFLDPRWLSRGSYVASVDLGRPWGEEHWPEVFDITATDDPEQSRKWIGLGKMLDPGEFDTDLGRLVAGGRNARLTTVQNTALLFAGVGIADIAVAKLVFDKAQEQGVGVSLPL